MTPHEMVILAGKSLTGTDNWAKKLARDLGYYHPDGSRGTIDPRSVSRWRTGEMEVLPWAAAALPRILQFEASMLEDEAAQMKASADRMRKAAARIEQSLEPPPGPRP
ncbi:hypothetical protein [Methylorubrum sp. GM97]|uniref:hypothetical protein n=1 Tax=Methylorubrum sp. GM97 TaxID=2938232 RepID=UPI00218C851C|nr:hypothetical protein [Methylorubrum sp. GM97]BDL39099.1 hypothetical protein MSPGM_16890 [Methylorubrum sp. GM97]